MGQIELPEIIGYVGGRPVYEIRGAAPQPGEGGVATENASGGTKKKAPSQNTGEATGGQEDPQDDPEDDNGTGPRGGKEAILADLARERQKRHDVEAQLAQLGQSQEQAEQFGEFKTALLDALGIKAGGDADLTPEGLLQQLNEFKQEQAEKEQQSETRMRRSGITALAKDMNFHNADDVMSKMDLSQVKLTGDGGIDETYAKGELDRIAREYPYLVRNTENAQDVGLGSVGSSDTPRKGKARLEQVYNTKK